MSKSFSCGQHRGSSLSVTFNLENRDHPAHCAICSASQGLAPVKVDSVAAVRASGEHLFDIHGGESDQFFCYFRTVSAGLKRGEAEAAARWRRRGRTSRTRSI